MKFSVVSGWFLLLTAGFYSSWASELKIPLAVNFSNPPKEVRIPGNVKLRNGILDLNGQNGGVYSVEIPLSVAVPCKVMLRVREVEVPQKDCHWGMVLKSVNGNTGQFFSRGKGVEVQLSTNRKFRYLKAFRDGEPPLKKGPDAPWTEFALSLYPHRVMLDMDGRTIGTDPLELLPLESVTIYACNNHVEVKSFSVVPLPKDETADAPAKRVLYASFDSGTDAVDRNGGVVKTEDSSAVPKTPGISGRAADLRKGGAIAGSPVKYVSGQRAADGCFFFDNLKKFNDFRLPVPKLGDFTFQMKFRRIKFNPQGQFMGVSFSGEAKQDLMLFAREEVWTSLQRKDGKDLSTRNFRTKAPLPPAGPDSPWIEFSVTRKDGVVSMTYQGETIPLQPIAFPVTSIAIYAYQVDGAVDEWSVASPGFQYQEDFNTDFTIGGKRELSYPVKGLVGNSGAVMFWFRPNWDGIANLTTYPLLQLVGADGKDRLSLFLWNWLRADVWQNNGKSKISIGRRDRGNYFKNDWVHFAVVWEGSGRVKLFVNGLPYLASSSWMKDSRFIPGADLFSATRLLLDSKADGSFDELKLYKGAVSNRIVYDEYRRHMPVDLVIRDAVVSPDREEAIGVRIAPPGYYMRPMPVRKPEKIVPHIDFVMTLTGSGGKVIDRLERKLKVAAPADMTFPARKLPAGEYRLCCEIKGKGGDFRRTFLFRSIQPSAPAPATNADIQMGKVFFEKKLIDVGDKELLHEGPLKAGANGSYLEAGPSKGDRFAFSIPIPEKLRNHGPVLLEIDWPDDKPRNMGFYMYKETGSRQHRDRLQGGVQAGVEFPSSGKMVTSRYLFYPGTAHYLFEARTMSEGYPAAVCVVRMREIPGGLPKLKILRPTGLPFRYFGNMDEDQTLTTSLTADNDTIPELFRLKYDVGTLLDYFDYTGQDTLHEPFLRYGKMFYYSREGTADQGVLGGGVGELSWVIDAFHRRGMKLDGILATSNLPEADLEPLVDSDFKKNGVFMLNSDGLPIKTFGAASGNLANFANPEAQKLFLDHVREFLELYARRSGFGGFELWLGRYGCWPSLKDGYSDYTVSAFCRDTGIRVPEKNRYEFLTGEKRREWLAWRASKVTGFVRAVRDFMNRWNPELPLYVCLVFDRGNGYDFFAENGIDVKMLRSIPGVFVTPIRMVTQHRHELHWGTTPSAIDSELYDWRRQIVLSGMPAALSISYPAYFETYTKSLDNRRFAAYFENADIKPHGRFFLKELVFDIAASDAQEMVIGAQPLGSWGRDAEVREFARNYGALPKLTFHTVPGSPDPVAVRYLETANGTYFYVTNLLFTPCKVNLIFASPVKSGIALADGSAWNGGELTLKPFELRSFLIPKQKMAISAFEVTVPESCISYYCGKLAELEKSLHLLEKNKVHVGTEKKIVDSIRRALKAGHYFEAHRLIFCPEMNEMNSKIANFDKVVCQSKLIAGNTFAVNCGSGTYYVAPDGRLFFPDQHWSEGKTYGYFGNYRSVMRSITGLAAGDLPELYRNEAYDIDGYRFKLANGKYTVRLYMKIGYDPEFREKMFVFSVFAQEKPLFTNLDLYKKAGGDFGKPVVLEFKNIKVTKGMLTLEFQQPHGGRGGNMRLCNAIEVIPQH